MGFSGDAAPRPIARSDIRTSTGYAAGAGSWLHRVPLRRLHSPLAHLVLITGAVFMLLPFTWMLTTSLKTYDQALAMPPQWIPWPPQWQNYATALTLQPAARYFANSVLVATITTLCEVVIGIYGAYAFARLQFLGKSILFTVLLATLMVPGEMLLIPNYILMAKLGWLNSFYALIVPWLTSVFAVFLLRQHFLSMPGELYEAAVVDGCGHSRFLWQVMVPLSRPAIATVALFKFIGSWNSFVWVLIMTNTAEMRTVPVWLTAFMQSEGPQYHLWMAAATMALLPVMALFMAAQRHFIEGVARVGIKG